MSLEFEQIVKSNMERKDELYTLCESIGDAEDAIQAGMLSATDLDEPRTKIDSWKNEFRRLINVGSSWEPEKGDWRMGCY